MGRGGVRGKALSEEDEDEEEFDKAESAEENSASSGEEESTPQVGPIGATHCPRQECVVHRHSGRLRGQEDLEGGPGKFQVRSTIPNTEHPFRAQTAVVHKPAHTALLRGSSRSV